MKKFINVYIKSDYDIVILRLSVIIIFMLFGTYKWFDFEVMALKPLISPTWLNILYIMFGVHGGSYFLGIVETITFLALSIGFFRPAAARAIFPLMVVSEMVCRYFAGCSRQVIVHLHGRCHHRHSALS